MEPKLSKTNQSVEKAMSLVEIMVRGREPMKLQDIAAQAGIPASTVLRMLNTLLELGYVNQDEETLRYYLSLKFAYIGDLISQQFSINRVAHRNLSELSQAVGECACLAVEENNEVVYLNVISDQNQTNSVLTVTQRIGKRAPMYCTGIGKLLLTNYSGEELAAYVAKTSMMRYTENTIVTLGELTVELERIAERGYALDNEECDIGAKCVAAPIRNYTGRVVAGISVTAPSLRLKPERIKLIAPIVMDYAKRISGDLAFQG